MEAVPSVPVKCLIFVKRRCGEMLYINKSKHHPMWAMEYCRDEGLRKYWMNILILIIKMGKEIIHSVLQ